MRICVFAIGLPIVMLSVLFLSIASVVDQTVVSVGPYMLTRST